MEGFPDLPCIRCGKENTSFLKLETMDEFWCSECEEDSTLEEIRIFTEKWQKVLAFLDGPKPPEEKSCPQP